MGPRPRVVVLSPDPLESQLLADWLVEAHDPVVTRLLPAAVHHVESRQPYVVIADARLAFDDALLSVCRAGGGTPVVVIGDPDRAAEAQAERHGYFYVTRPVDRDLLLCTVAMALADGRPVRRSPRKGVMGFGASIEGISAALVDVSNEGLRIAFPRGRQSMLTPFFTVRVPIVGLTLVVQRIWLAAPPAQPAGYTWCGAALANNAAREEQKWRTFVDMLPVRA